MSGGACVVRSHFEEMRILSLIKIAGGAGKITLAAIRKESRCVRVRLNVIIKEQKTVQHNAAYCIQECERLLKELDAKPKKASK